MSTYNFNFLILDKDDKIILKKIKNLQQMVLGNLMSTNGRLKTELYYSPCSRTNSNCSKDLNLHRETLKLLEENIGSVIHGTIVGKDFLSSTPFAQKLSGKKQLALRKTANLL